MNAVRLNRNKLALGGLICWGGVGLALGGGWVAALSGATLYWDSNSTTSGAGTTPTGTWGTSAFWSTSSGGTAATANTTTTSVDSLFFSADADAVNPYTITVNGTQAAQLLTFEEGTPTFTGGTINLGAGGGITLATTTVTGATISSNLGISGNQTFNIGAARTLTLNTGTFTRNAGATLNVQDSGTLASTQTNLSANNAAGIIGTWASFGTGASTKYATFSGSTITGLTGTAAATGANLTDTTGAVNYNLAAGGGTVPATVSANTIRYTGAAGTTAPGATSFTVNGLMNAGTGLWTIGTNALTIGADRELVVNAANNAITISGIIKNNAGGASSLTKTGSGTLTLSGANTFTGGVVINSGTLKTATDNNTGALGQGNLTINGGELSLVTNTSVNYARNTTVAGDATITSVRANGQSGGITYTFGSLTIGSHNLTAQGGSSNGNLGLAFGATTLTGNAIFTSNLNVATSMLLTLASLDNGGFSPTFNGTGNAKVTGVVSGTGGLTKAGAGTLTLSGANTFTGGVTITDGKLVNSNGSGVLNAANVVTVGGGSGTNPILDISSNGLTVAGLNDGGFSNGIITNFSLSNRSLTLGGSDTYSYGGAIGTGATGIFNLSKTGTGTQTLAGTNTYTGTTTVSAGTLRAGSTSALSSSSALTLANTAGALLDLNGFNNTLGSLAGGGTTGGNVALGAAILTTGGNNTSTTYAGVLSGTGGLTKTGTGTFTLSGTNTFTGEVTVSEGTLKGNGANWLSSGVNVVSLGNTTGTSPTLDISNSSIIIAGLNDTVGATTKGIVTNSGSTAGKSITVSGAGNYSYSGVITNSALGGVDFIKSGSGTQTLAGANSYTGTTTVNAGTLAYTQASNGGSAGGLGQSSAAAANLLLGNGTTLSYTGAGGSTDRLFTLNGTAAGHGATLDASGAGAIAYTGTGALAYGTTNQTRTLTLAGSNTGANSLAAALADNGSGALSLTKTGVGTWTLSGTNSYTGGTTLNAGTLAFTTGGLGTTGMVNFAGNATLQYGAATTTDLSSRLAIANGVTATFDTQGNDVSFATGFGASGTGALTKTGSGTLSLNAATTYTGLTTVNAGALNIGASGSLASGNALTVGESATADFANAGQTLGAVSNTNTASNALNFSATTGTVTLGSLSGGGNTRFGSDAVVTDGITSGTVTSVGNLNANLSGSGTTVTVGGLLTGDISGGTVGAGSLSAGTVSGGATTVTGAAGITTQTSGTTTVGGVATLGTLSGGTANLNGTTSAISTLNGGTVNLGGSTALTVSAGSSAGTITGDGSLTRAGSGTLTLTGANSYTGTTTVSSGVLNIQHATALGSTDAGTSVAAGAALQLQNNITIGAESLTLSGSGIANDGALRNIAGTTTFGGLVTLGGAARINSDAGTLTLSNAGTITGAGFNLTLGGAGDLVVNSIIGIGAGNLIKDGSGTVTLSGANTFTGTTTISAGTLRLGVANALDSTSAIFLNNVAGAVLDLNGFDVSLGSLSGGGNLGGGVNLGANTLSVGADNTSTTYASSLSGLGGLTKTGTGTLTLTGSNTYTGTTRVSGGTLQAGSTSAFGTHSAVVLDNTAAVTLDLDSYDTTIGSLAGGGTSGGNVSLGFASLTTGGDGSSTLYEGVISGGGGSLIKAGSGTLTLTGANTFDGLTTVNAGTLVIGSSGSLASGNDLTLGANGAATFANSSPILGAVSNANTASNALNFSASTGTVILGSLSGLGDTRFGSNARITGGVSEGTVTTVGQLTARITGGTVGAGSLSAASVSGGNTSVTGAAVITTQSGGTTTVGGVATIGTLAGGTANLNGATSIITAFNGGTVNLGGSTALSVSRGTSAGTITGGGSLAKTGSDTLTLTGANSYTGATTVSTGVLNILHATALGTTDAGTTVASGAALQLQGGITVGAEALTLSGSGVANDGALRNISGATTFGGLITLGANTRINSDAGTLTLSNAGTLTGSGFDLTLGGAGDLVVNSIIGIGAGNLIKDGSGTVTLSGANTFTGTTTISAGTLRLGVANALDSTSAIYLNNVAGAVLDLNGFGVSLGSLSGGGNLGGGVNLGANTLSVGADNSSTTFASSLSGLGGLTKTGTGTLTLNAVNTYTGATTVSAGTLRLNSASGGGAAAHTSAVTIATGGSIALGAAQQINANARLTLTGGTLVLGGFNQTLGTLALSANSTLNLDGSAQLVFADSSALDWNSSTLSIVNFSATTNSLRFGTTAGGLTATQLALIRFYDFGNVAGQIDASGFLAPLSSNYVNAVSAATEIATVITGTTTVQQTGSGTTTLTGSNTSTGTATVTAGTLVIGTSAGGNWAGDVTVGGAGILKGSGTIAGAVTLTTGGTYSPGNSPAIQHVGSLTVNSGTLTAIELDGATAGNGAHFHDQVVSAGAVTLNGGTLSAVTVFSGASGYVPAFGTSHTIITGSAVNGTFAAYNFVAGNNPVGVTWLPEYTATAVNLIAVPQNYAAVAGLTLNQTQLGAALQSMRPREIDNRAALSATGTLFNGLMRKTSAELGAAYDQLSPEKFTALAASTFQSASLLNAAVVARSAELRRVGSASVSLNGMATPAPAEDTSVETVIEDGVRYQVAKAKPKNRVGYFASASGAYATVDGSADRLGSISQTGSGHLGLDYALNEHHSVGGVVGQAYAETDFGGAGGSARTTTNRLSVFHDYHRDGFYLNTSVSLGFSQMESQRHVAFLQQTANGTTQALSFGGQLAGGYEVKLGDFILGPSASLAYDHARVNGFTETGSAADLAVDRQAADSLLTSLGFHASRPFEWQHLSWIPEVSFAVSRQHFNPSAVSAQFAAGGDRFSVQPQAGGASLSTPERA